MGSSSLTYVPFLALCIRCPDAASYSKKYKDWFLQLDLMGAPQIFLGLTDKDDVLQSTQLMDTDGLLVDSKSGHRWDVKGAYDFGFRTLCTIRDYLQETADHMEFTGYASKYTENRVWLIQVRGKTEPSGSIHVRELTAEERRALNSGENAIPRTGIIPKALLKELQSTL